MTIFQPPPTYVDPVTVDQTTKKGKFEPIWLRWFLDFAQFINNNGGGGPIQHNNLAGIQGGSTNQYYHLTQATATLVGSIGTPTAGSVAYGNGASIQFNSAGTANQFLVSSGTSAPTFRAILSSDIPTLPYNPVSAPVTYTANFTVATTNVYIICNKAGSSCTVTLPTASSCSGRLLRFQNYQAQTVISASINVVPLGGGAAGTTILPATVGSTCTLVSDGTNWINV